MSRILKRRMTLYITEELNDQINLIADRLDVSGSYLCHVLIQHAIENDEGGRIAALVERTRAAKIKPKIKADRQGLYVQCLIDEASKVEAQDIADSSGRSVPDVIREALRQFVGWPDGISLISHQTYGPAKFRCSVYMPLDLYQESATTGYAAGLSHSATIRAALRAYLHRHRQAAPVALSSQ